MITAIFEVGLLVTKKRYKILKILKNNFKFINEKSWPVYKEKDMSQFCFTFVFVRHSIKLQCFFFFFFYMYLLLSIYLLQFVIGLPWWLSGKEPDCQSRRHRLIPGSGRSPGVGNGNPLQYSRLGKSHGQNSMVV